MGENNLTDTLDKDSRKRLEKLSSQWETNKQTFVDRLSLPDLRLLLERHPPLQELIRSIVNAPAAPGEAPARPLAEAQTLNATHTALNVARQELEDLHRRYTELEKELAATQHRYVQESAAQQQEIQQLKKLLQEERTALESTRSDLARAACPPAELSILREDAELAKQLELGNLPDDSSQALIQAVAVLAQRENLDRLWSLLKDRCEVENRAASPAERALLTNALGWYNHNWRSKPYRLIETRTNTPFDYEQNLRSHHTPSGEAVIELRLPGFADGSGKPRCKALVTTR